jgi:hypothetical protein
MDRALRPHVGGVRQKDVGDGGARVESPNGGDYLNDVWYSANGVNWTEATDSAPWAGRYCHASATFDNAMWVLGGCNGSERNDVWYSRDSNGVKWTRACSSAAWAPRNLYTDVDTFDNKIWVIGGCGGGDTAQTDVWWSQGATAVQEANSPGKTRLSLTSLRPNPFRDKAMIFCEAPRGERISVRIYSSNGALVKVPGQDVVARGAEQLQWNGANQKGAQAPPGPYFVRLDCGATTITRKLAKLD